MWTVVGLVLGGAVIATAVLGWQIFREFVDINVPIMHPRKGLWGIAKVVSVVIGIAFIIFLLISWRLSTI